MARTIKHKKGSFNFDLEKDIVPLIAAKRRLGWSQEQIYKLIGISKGTYFRWGKENNAIRDAQKITKEIADSEVANALYKRALGYEYIETEVKETIDGNGIKTQLKRQYKKQMPPDVTAQIFYLKNRARLDWQDVNRTELTDGEGKPFKPEVIIFQVPDNGRGEVAHAEVKQIESKVKASDETKN